MLLPASPAPYIGEDDNQDIVSYNGTSTAEEDFTQEFIDIVSDIYHHGNDTGVLADSFNYFKLKIDKIKLNDVDNYQIYSEHINSLNNNLAEIQLLEKNLIERHMNAGEHLCAIQEWFIDNFETVRGWEEFVLSQIEYEYSIRTSQRDMMCWRRLSKYKDLLVHAGNSKLAISTVYFLANPEKTSDIALEWAISLIEKYAGSMDAPILPAYNRLTGTKAKEIAAAAQFIENRVEDSKREVLQQIAITHNVSNVSLIKELAQENIETLNEIKTTGHIEYLLDTTTGAIQKTIPVSEASITDVELLRDSEEYERNQRYIVHRREGAKDRERREYGTESEYLQTIHAPIIKPEIFEGLVQFLKEGYHEADTMALLQMIGAIASSQGNAGSKIAVYRVNYVESEFEDIIEPVPDEDIDLNVF